MKTRFKSTLLQEGGDYGIPHLEDLDIETFVRAVERIHDLHAVQKLDGANLRVGMDEKGELFTSREQKGGKRFYSEHDFPKMSSFDGFKAATAVIQKAEGFFLETLNKGESINLEIIFGEQPNTVLYGKDGLNYIALLEMLPGDDPSIQPDQSKIKKLYSALKDKQFTVKTIFSDTPDGISLTRAPRVTDWKFCTSDEIEKHDLSDLEFDKELGLLKKYLRAENDEAQNQGRDLTNFEVLKDRSKSLSDERKAIAEKIMSEFKLPIKQKLLDLVYRQKPSLRGKTPEDDGTYTGIEGIIFTDPKTREKFKVVDKDVFTSINKFNYEVRKTVASRIMSSDENLPIESRGGLVGEAQLRALKMFGIEGAELPRNAKTTLAKFKGDTIEETVHNISQSLHQLSFNAVKRKIQAIYISTLDDLEESLDSFKKNAEEYSLELKNGKKVKYTKEIKRRTLMVFAEARRDLIEMIGNIRRSDDIGDLITLFFKPQLEQLFNGKEE